MAPSEQETDAVERAPPRNRDQHGSRDYVAERVTDRLAVIRDGTLLRTNPPEQPTVADVVEPGALIRTNYGERTRKVFKVRQLETYGLPTYALMIGDPDDVARQDGYPKNYS